MNSDLWGTVIFVCTVLFFIFTVFSDLILSKVFFYLHFSALEPLQMILTLTQVQICNCMIHPFYNDMFIIDMSAMQQSVHTGFILLPHYSS